MEGGVYIPHSKGMMLQESLERVLYPVARQHFVFDLATKRPWLSLSHSSTGMCDCHQPAALKVCSSHWMGIIDKQEAVLRESVSLRAWYHLRL